MPQTVYWNANPAADEVTTYEVWSSTDNVTFTLLASIPADMAGPNFDTNLSQFFFLDSVSPSTTWYKVRAQNSSSVFSSFTISMQGEPTDLPTCRIYGRVVGFDGVPLPGTAVMAHVQLTAKDMSGQFITNVGILSDDVEAYTDNEGNFEIDLAQGGIAEIEIAAINLDKTLTVPAQATALLTDLI